MNEVLIKIKFLLPSLPKAEKKVATFLTERPEEFRSMTLALLSQESGSSEASIIRLCRRLGFDGFSAMKRAYLANFVDINPKIALDVNPDDGVQEIYKKVVQNNIKTMQDTGALISSEYELAVNAILAAKSIHFFGVGDAYATGLLGHMKFNRLGIGGSAHSDVMMQLSTASMLGEHDIAIAVSYSGASETVVKAMKVAKVGGATTIAITKSSKSPLLKYIDINLFISTEDFTVGKDIVANRMADLTIIETLYVAVLTKSNRDNALFIRKSQKAIDLNKM